MLGYGTALKVLFLPREELIPSALSRNEIVAFINTIAGMSESIKEVRELTAMYWAGQIRSSARSGLPMPDGNGAVMDSNELVDAAVGAASELAKAGRISTEREAELVSLAFSKDSNLMILAKHYGTDLDKFFIHSQNIGNLAGDGGEPDAIVIGDIGNRWGYDLLNSLMNQVLDGAEIIALHKGRYHEGQSGLVLDSGAFVAALEHATGKQAIVVGKPTQTFFELASHSFGCKPKDLIMVGDDLINDIKAVI